MEQTIAKRGKEQDSAGGILFITFRLVAALGATGISCAGCGLYLLLYGIVVTDSMGKTVQEGLASPSLVLGTGAKLVGILCLAGGL